MMPKWPASVWRDLNTPGIKETQSNSKMPLDIQQSGNTEKVDDTKCQWGVC